MYSLLQPGRPIAFSGNPFIAKLLQNRVCAGFPSPAEDLGAQRIDLTQVLVTHPQATYFMRASGHSMVEAGIFDNDIIVVDRAIKPRHNHVVVAIVDGDFTVKHLYSPQLSYTSLTARFRTSGENLFVLLTSARLFTRIRRWARALAWQRRRRTAIARIFRHLRGSSNLDLESKVRTLAGLVF